jgi:hypothetical protein
MNLLSRSLTTGLALGASLCPPTLSLLGTSIAPITLSLLGTARTASATVYSTGCTDCSPTYNHHLIRNWETSYYYEGQGECFVYLSLLYYWTQGSRGYVCKYGYATLVDWYYCPEG